MKFRSLIITGTCECKENSITQFIFFDHLLTIVDILLPQGNEPVNNYMYYILGFKNKLLSQVPFLFGFFYFFCITNFGHHKKMDNQDLSLNLRTIDTSSLVDKVEMRLIEVFLYRELQPGDTIPKETELATLMGVSRTVIRESLNRLKTMDLIESKKHKGTIIKSPDLSAILRKSIIPRMLDHRTLMNIFEIRLALEVGMSDFIFSRKKEADIEELSALADLEPDHSESILFDMNQELKFHGKLYQMTGNDTLEDFQTLLLPAFQYVYSSGMLKSKGKRRKYISHRGLVSLLDAGTADEFREGMRSHLENHYHRILSADPVPAI